MARVSAHTSRSCGTITPPAQEIERAQAELEAYRAAKGPQERIESIVVPVVFHILHDGNTGFVSDNVIQGQLEHINNEFEGSGFQFTLLRTERTDNPEYYNCNRNTFDEVKRLLRDPQGDGLDVLYFYVCNFVDGILGYAQFPFFGETVTDGIACTTFSITGFSIEGNPYSEGDTAIHEIGTFLPLPC